MFGRGRGAGLPGVECMLGHAPSFLAASGLDMGGGHPAEPHATANLRLESRTEAFAF